MRFFLSSEERNYAVAGIATLALSIVLFFAGAWFLSTGLAIMAVVSFARAHRAVKKDKTRGGGQR